MNKEGNVRCGEQGGNEALLAAVSLELERACRWRPAPGLPSPDLSRIPPLLQLSTLVESSLTK